nr:DUF3265 domain-containing protein [Vibrio coralliilyticus]
MRNALAFLLCVTLVIKMVFGGLGIALLAPLTGR